MLFLLVLLSCVALEANAEEDDCVLEKLIDLKEKFEKCFNDQSIELYQAITKDSDGISDDLCKNINRIETACVGNLLECFGEDYIRDKLEAQMERMKDLFVFSNLKHSECKIVDSETRGRKHRTSR